MAGGNIFSDAVGLLKEIDGSKFKYSDLLISPWSPRSIVGGHLLLRRLL